jgi:cbb3-type cytochrome oxidase subunit 3
LVPREEVVLCHHHDFVLILGSKMFRVLRFHVAYISIVFRTLLEGPFAEAQRTIVQLNEDLDALAMEVLMADTGGSIVQGTAWG